MYDAETRKERVEQRVAALRRRHERRMTEETFRAGACLYFLVGPASPDGNCCGE